MAIPQQIGMATRTKWYPTARKGIAHTRVSSDPAPQTREPTASGIKPNQTTFQSRAIRSHQTSDKSSCVQQLGQGADVSYNQCQAQDVLNKLGCV